jgi:hypothetical protein
MTELSAESNTQEVAAWPRRIRLLGQRTVSRLTVFDCLFVCTLLALTYPALKIAGLPFQFDLAALAGAYVGLPLGAVFVAVVYSILGLPWSQTVAPAWHRFREKKALMALIVLAASMLMWMLGPAMGMVVMVDTLAIAELMARRGRGFESALLDVLIPGVFLFCGLVAVFAFNHAIVGMRYGGTYDSLLDKLDAMLFGAHVSSIAQWSVEHLPAWVFQLEDMVYFSIWSRVGAALVLSAVLGGRQYAMKHVRTMLICYTIGLAIFLALPAKGPYSTSPAHGDVAVPALGADQTQRVLVDRMKKLWAHDLTADVREVGTGDYYVSFPSMHAALPIISLWFLRRWRKIQLIQLVLYVTLLLPALILLEWHYVVDMLGGFGLAFFTIWVSERISKSLAGPRPEDALPAR